jgi:hypothetical protein
VLTSGIPQLPDFLMLERRILCSKLFHQRSQLAYLVLALPMACWSMQRVQVMTARQLQAAATMLLQQQHAKACYEVEPSA